MNLKLRENVEYVGKIDWELRSFHGEELSTHRGSSYNSYLIQDEKTVLIDTVWTPYAEEFVENLKKKIDLKDIDYIIAQHNEIDHSGALPLLMKEIPNTPIYCTEQGEKIIRGHFHEDWNFVNVKTGDTLNIGDATLTFVEARMLHWPDSMMTYMDTERILFSNDAFGQHLSSNAMYNDLIDECELYQEALKYYANILAPFSMLLKNKLKELDKMNLDIDMIAPSHGVIWRDNPSQIIEKYREWSDNYLEDQVTIVYDTMWDSTKKMAEAIACGIQETSPKTIVKMYNMGQTDKNDVLTEIFKSRAILAGSSTINKSIASGISGLLDMLRGLGLKNRKAGAFGSYGWSGESVSILNERLEVAKFELVNDGIKAMWNPDEDSIEACLEYGREFGKNL